MGRAQRRSNLRKHGLDFRDAASIFAGATSTSSDDRFAYGEARFLSFGLLRGRVVVVAHTETADVIRIISIRKANRHEQACYFETVAD